jgi:predicted GIY-YIG superfamily endonuclease
MFSTCLSRVLVIVCFCLLIGQAWSQNDETIRNVFAKVHDGWSVDELLIRDELRAAFLSAGAEASQKDRNADWDKSMLERLIQIRKAGKLSVVSTKRNVTDLESVLPVAEIASRQMMDSHQANIDQWLVDEKLLDEFDMLVQSIVPGCKPYEARKGALQLRKTRKLQPELLSRVMDWKREIRELTVEEAAKNATDLPTNPGVYIFRDATGYLYIGQSNNLRTRLTKHLQDSDRKSLGAYLKERGAKDMTLELHIFASDSPASSTKVREAYESDLIRTRKPRLNVAP